MPFSIAQQALIRSGQNFANDLKQYVEEGLGLRAGLVEVKRHTYIYSPPGAGKTFTVLSTAAANNINLIAIRGQNSMPNFVRRLAAEVYYKQTPEIIVWVDDCDTLFEDITALNMMKVALDSSSNLLVYGMSLTAQINRDMESEDPKVVRAAVAMKSFQPLNGAGVEIPTDNVRFIFTSNNTLCAPNALKKTKKQNHESAIRDRINYRPFELTWQNSWGWTAHVVMNPACVLGPGIKLTNDEKEILLNFIYKYWAKMPSTSMREIETMAADIRNYPATYHDMWLRRIGL